MHGKLGVFAGGIVLAMAASVSHEMHTYTVTMLVKSGARRGDNPTGGIHALRGAVRAAADRGDIEALRALAEPATALWQTDDQGAAVHYTALRGDIATLETLLEMGADPEIRAIGEPRSSSRHARTGPRLFRSW